MVRRKAKASPSPSLLPGYSDLVEIGGGAFATVYRAKEDETGREVALKVLKVDTVHPHLVETFQREIHALAKVSDHPNIVTLYRPLQTPDGRPVLVLELCRNSLSHQIRTSGPLTAEDATRVGIKIAGALETAHRSGFLHRDMKPQNILITNFGEPALADFGVAALQASAQATVGVFGFTTLHAAPEMLEGHHLSPATDVYGLASTMYQLLAGRAPFAAFDNEAPASVILRILRDPVRPLHSDGIPLALSDLLEASLSKEPERRPRTALEFAVALQTVEEAEGWTPTSYVAWGHADWSDGAGDEADHRAAPRRPARPARPVEPATDGRQLYQSAPSVEVAGVENPSRPSLPPLLPASHPAARTGSEPAYSPGTRNTTGPPPSPLVAPPGSPAPLAAGASAGSPAPVAPATAGSEPSASPGPLRPSVATPAPTGRNVVSPIGARRGQPPGRPLVRSEPLGTLEPPGPLREESASLERPAGARISSPAVEREDHDKPIFVDPLPEDRLAGQRRADAIYEQTMDVGRLFGAPRHSAVATAPPPARRALRELPPLVVMLLGFAAAVVIAAVLLIAGVI